MFDNNFKSLIREFVLFELNNRNIPIETFISVAEKIGANEKLNVERDLIYFKPFLKKYKNLYRTWQMFSSDESVNTIENFASSHVPLSATTSIQSIKQMNDELGLDDLAVTTFDAIGFDPYNFLEIGIQQYPSNQNVVFFKSVIANNKFQKEIIVFKIASKHKKVKI